MENLRAKESRVILLSDLDFDGSQLVPALPPDDLIAME